MGGIFGTVGFSDKDLLEKMSNVISHRGPIKKEIILEDVVGFGVRNLNITNSDVFQQPIHNEEGNLHLIFCGEIYNSQELKNSLQIKGHRFYTNEDIEIIVHLYEDKGKDCVKDLRGAFSFAIWDSRNKEFFLARDRLGIKPMYYVLNKGNLLFASELKSLLEADIKLEIDLKAIDLFLSYLYIPAPYAIFNEIKKLPAACTLTWKDGKVTIEQYWDLKLYFSEVNKVRFKEEYYKEKLIKLLKEAIDISENRNVPLGIFLSGGLDSSAILALIHKQGTSQVKSFSVGYSKEGVAFNELEYAKKTAGYFNNRHYEYTLTSEIVEDLPKIIWHLDEPLADSSAIPTYFISQKVKENVDIALVGVGGDELFAGYPRYIGVKLANFYQKLPLILRKNIILKLAEMLPESVSPRNWRGWIKRFAQGGILPPQERYISWIICFSEQMKKKLYVSGIREIIKKFKSSNIYLECFEDTNTSDIFSQIFYVDIKNALINNTIMMTEKMGMANSLLLQFPLCDYKLFEFSASIPFSIKMKRLNLKYLFKESMRDFLPQGIIRRKKTGFMCPIGEWLKDEWKEFTNDLLSYQSIKRRGLFSYEYIQLLLNQHRIGKQNFSDQIWALLVLELWFRIYIDK